MSRDRRSLYGDEIKWAVRQAAALARDGAPAGSLVMTESRTLLRGRFGLRLKVPRGNSLVFAVVLRPPLVDAPRLTLDALASVAEAIEATIPVEVRMRWPGDLCVGERRVGAVVVDVAGAGAAVPWAVAGVGIDVNAGDDELPEPLKQSSTSLKIATGRRVHRIDLLAQVLGSLLRECSVRSASPPSGVALLPVRAERRTAEAGSS